MLQFRKYGKSYIYDRLHRGIVIGLIALCLTSVIDCSVGIYRATQAVGVQEESSKSEKTGDNVDNTGKSLTTP